MNSDLWNDEKIGDNLASGSNPEERKRFWLKQVFINVQRIEEKEWRAEIDKQPKLRSYRTFKTRAILINQ